MNIQIGIDNLKENSKKILKKKNIILLTGSSNVDSSGTPVYQVIKKLIGNKLKAIWSIQHGFFCDKQDNMIFSDSFFWKDFEIEIKSLYREKLLPEENWLDGIDSILIDVFDIGTRVYTFLNHIIMILKFLSGRDIEIILLDRPNPLNGIDCEGNVIGKDNFSILGQIPVPMRHSLTAGEYVGFALNYYKIDVKLEIVEVKNWDRDYYFKGVWTYPSPNMPCFSTAVVYPGAVMIEGTNLSEGRGTTWPFKFIGAPFVDNFKIIEEIKRLDLKGVKFIPVFFKPEFSKFSKELCNGVLIHPENIKEFRSFQTCYEIIRLTRAFHLDKFKWKEPPYEFEYERLPIDMICGSDFVRKSIENNIPFEDIKPQIDSEIKNYREEIEDFLLY